MKTPATLSPCRSRRRSEFCPWAPGTGWILCDGYLANGDPVPFSARQILKKMLAALEERGFDYIAGIEVECHIYRLEDPMLRPEDAGQPAEPPKVSLIARGYNYLTELRMDEQDPVFETVRRDLLALGLPLRTLETSSVPASSNSRWHRQQVLRPLTT